VKRSGALSARSLVGFIICAGVVGLGVGVGASPARADGVLVPATAPGAPPSPPSQQDPPSPPSPQDLPIEREGAPALGAHDLQDTAQGGVHFRLDTPNGVVHVWHSGQWDANTAGTVIYLHGHRSTSDSAWSEHHLAQQFAGSGLNALFIVPDSTTDNEEVLHWESLGALRREVERRTGLTRPPGALVVIGHSGAFRNIAAWLDDRSIDHLILLDAMYSREEDFLSWIERSPGHEKKRLTIVSRDTRKNALKFMRQIPASVGVKEIPASFAKLSKRQQAAQVLNLRSQYDHMGIVTSGAVIPLVLQRTGLGDVHRPSGGASAGVASGKGTR
jgi:hypothetical protein